MDDLRYLHVRNSANREENQLATRCKMNTYYIKKNDKEVQICNREFEEVVQLFRIVEETSFEKSDHYKVVDWFGDEIIASVYYKN